MIVVCAWCQKLLGVKAPEDDITVSHGICRGCSERAVPFDLSTAAAPSPQPAGEAFFPVRSAGRASRALRSRD
jgi:hypothetical protein